MRKALLGILLVAAAFAGGAVVNGPGLERLKAMIQARLNPPANPPAGDRPALTLAMADEPPRAVPAAPLPPLPMPLAAENRAEQPSTPIDSTPTEPKESDDRQPEPRPAKPRPVELPPTTDREVAPAPQPTAASRDWSDLRRKMRELGVSRYEIDGEPGGRARFRCLIPLAGRRAVGQQFEGEGDDDFQAADAALRRVALWRATETVPQ